MRRHWRLWKMALRAVLWRTTAEPPVIGPVGLAGWTLATILLLLALQIPTSNAIFSEYGLGLLAGAVVVSLGAAALPLPPAHRVGALAAMLLIGVAALLVTMAGLAIISPQDASSSGGLWTRSDTRIALLFLQAIWLIGAYAAIIRSVDPERRYAPCAAPPLPAPCRPRCCWRSRTIRPSSRRARTTVHPTAGRMCAA